MIYLLSKYEEVIFWYAGEGDTTEIDKIIEKYPQRVFLTHERTDLYQVLEKCYFYLSTYPLCGGLMFQYVAKAGKIPLTLRYDRITDGFLINQEKLNIQFDDIKDIYSVIDRLMTDSDYVKKQENIMRSSVISEEDFNAQIAKLFTGNEQGYAIQYENIDTSCLKEECLDNVKEKKLYTLCVTANSLCLIKYMPIKMLVGLLNGIKNTIKRVFNKSFA